MNAFEFQARPENGHIEIPAEYKDRIVGNVRVIVLAPERAVGANDLIDRLLEHPLKVEGFVPLSREEVYERR
ncbi:MAG: hypothetical protein H0W76_19880 [Pyrinomonadaceae bacterium]|nr:hypothetical protein [Pyrinomonadaceae bacterium]